MALTNEELVRKYDLPDDGFDWAAAKTAADRNPTEGHFRLLSVLCKGKKGDDAAAAAGYAGEIGSGTLRKSFHQAHKAIGHIYGAWRLYSGLDTDVVGDWQALRKAVWDGFYEAKNAGHASVAVQWQGAIERVEQHFTEQKKEQGADPAELTAALRPILCRDCLDQVLRATGITPGGVRLDWPNDASRHAGGDRPKDQTARAGANGAAVRVEGNQLSNTGTEYVA